MTAKGHEFVTAEQIETLQRRPVAAMVLDIARYIFSEGLFGEKDLRMNVAPILLRAFHIISVGRLSRQDQCSGRPRQIDPHMYFGEPLQAVVLVDPSVHLQPEVAAGVP